MIRPVNGNELSAVLSVARSCGLFDDDELTTLAKSFEESYADPHTTALWMARFDGNGSALAVVYCVEERMADRVWNVLFIGVDSAHKGRGIGSALLQHVELTLKRRSQRLLIVETGTGSEFENVHRFYTRNQYEKEGIVRDFYADGEHKTVFRKRIS